MGYLVNGVLFKALHPTYWGGTWIVGAKGTDNPTLVRDMMLKLTANEKIMKTSDIRR